MKSLLKGLASFPHILTEEDVLRHSYGIEPEVSAAMSEPVVDVPVVAEEPVAEEPVAEEPVAEEPVSDAAADAPAADAPAADAPAAETPAVTSDAPAAETTSGPPAAPTEAELSDEEFAQKLERDNTKAVLVGMAEAAGLDATGNKSDLSVRLAAHRHAK